MKKPFNFNTTTITPVSPNLSPKQSTQLDLQHNSNNNSPTRVRQVNFNNTVTDFKGIQNVPIDMIDQYEQEISKRETRNSSNQKIVKNVGVSRNKTNLKQKNSGKYSTLTPISGKVSSNTYNANDISLKS